VSFNAATFFVDRHVAEGRGERPAFRHHGRTITCADVAEAANRAGHALAGLGLGIEQRVVLALDDSPAFVATFWAAAKLGAVAVPVNTIMRSEEYAFLLQDSRARIVVAEPAVAETIRGVSTSSPWLRAVLTTDELARLMAKAPSDLTPAATVDEDVMYWGYTSGSTGLPKAAVHSHRDFVAAADLVGVGIFGLGPDDLTFSASKMYFAFGLGNTLYFPQRVGASSLLVPERLDPARIFELIEAERPTVFFAVATVYARLLQIADAKPRDLSSLRLCVSSGEALPPAVFDAWRERFGLVLHDVVGSTEALHDFIANPPGATRRGSAGKVVPGFEARLVDDEGQPVATGTVGHLLIKGPTTSSYYWNRRERTRTTMLGEWLRTGDMFSRDEDGYFYLAGRSDDMLKVRGMWVSPIEIEAALVAHPDVIEAAVVGRPDGDGLLKAHAFVVMRPGHALAETDMKAFLHERLAGYKIPDRIEVVDDLPKTATGKIQRFRLR